MELIAILFGGGLVIFAVTLRAALRLAIGPSPSPKESIYVVLARVISWFLIVCAIFVGFIIPVTNWFVIWAVVMGMLYHRHVASQQDAMLGLLAGAVERNVPLPIAFAAMGSERRGWMAQRAVIVSELMASGKTLPESLKYVPTVLSADGLPLVSIGCASGLLGPALRRILAERAATAQVWQSLVGRATYILLLPAIFVVMVGFLLIRIAPMYQKIFRDFDMRLPDITLAVFSISGQWSLLVAAVVILGTLSWSLMYYALLRYSGAIHWDLPGLGWFIRRLDRAVVLDALSLAATGQRPLPETVGLLADTYPKRSIRRRLEKALVAINQGLDGLECLKRNDLLGAVDMAVLQAAQRNGNLAWAAQEMADSNRRRFQYFTIALMQIIFPAIILVMACIVGFIVAAMFLPLVSIILRLSN